MAVTHGSDPEAAGDDPRVEHSDHDVRDLAIPIPRDGIRWTPQGLAYSDEQDLFVHAMYDHDDPGAGLLVIQPADGGPVRRIRIEGNSHYGGVTIAGDNVYVCGNGGPGHEGSHVQRYSLADLQRAAGETARPGKTARPVEPAFRVPTGSTLTTHDGSLYLARFSRNKPGQQPPMVYEYVLGAGGSLPAVGTNPVDRFDAPEGTQGLTTSDGENFFFTQSHGFGGHSTLTHAQRHDPRQHSIVRADLSALSQGVVIRDGQFVITNESSSEAYRAKVEATDSPFVPNVIERPVRPDPALQAYDVPDAVRGHPRPSTRAAGRRGRSS